MNGRVNDVILYGAGNQGKYAVDIVKNYGLNPVAFCDADEKKAGTIYCGLPVFTKDETRKQFGENLKLWADALLLHCTSSLYIRGLQR